jgi:hypothetical protein
MDWIKNKINNVNQEIGKKLYPPPEADVFQVNGELSPNEFKRAGDHLTTVCTGWTWRPSLNPNFISKYLAPEKQYLVLEKVISKKRHSQQQQELPK